MNEFKVYLIKFDGHNPFQIRARNFLELMDLIKYNVERYKKPFSWIIEDY